MFIIFNLIQNLSLFFPFMFSITLEFWAKWSETSFMLLLSCLWMWSLNKNSALAPWLTCVFICLSPSCPLCFKAYVFQPDFCRKRDVCDTGLDLAFPTLRGSWFSDLDILGCWTWIEHGRGVISLVSSLFPSVLVCTSDFLEGLH